MTALTLGHGICGWRICAGDHPVGIFLRCAAWGIAIGAALGATLGLVTGVLAMGSGGQWVVLGPLTGALYGTVLSFLPAVVTAFAMAETLHRRHPNPSSPEVVERDVLAVLAKGLGLSNLLVIIAVIAGSGSASSLPLALVALVLPNLFIAALLPKVRTAITRAWTGVA